MISSRSLVFPGAWIRKEVVRNFRWQTRWILESNGTSSRESSSTLSNSVSIRNTMFFVSSFSPIHVIVHWHEDDHSFELLWFTLWFSHHLMNLVENSNVVNPWKFCHSNSVGSPSVRSKSLRQRVSKNHLILFSQALTGSVLIPPRQSTESEKT